MKIEIYTDSSQELIDEIFNASREETIKTWIIRESKEGKAFLTHKPDQWVDKALFGFINNKDKLIIHLTWWSNNVPTEDIKGYYMGRFTEVLLVNFSDKYGKFEIEK